VAFHVASNAEGFPATSVRAFERLLAGVTMAVNAQAARPRERLVASRANVAVLRLGEGSLAGCADIMMVLPWVRPVLSGPC